MRLRFVQEKDAAYARLAEEFVADARVPAALREMVDDARVTVRRGWPPPSQNRDAGHSPGGTCVVYWMQRAQRGWDNHALDKAVAAANALGLPCVVYFAVVSGFAHANLRHYAFLQQGLPDVAEACEERGVGFVMRRADGDSAAGEAGREDVVRFCEEAGAALVVSDENPLRGPERWRESVAERLRAPFWTVDTDVIVPSKLLEKAQYSAGVARPRLYRALREFVQPYENLHAAKRWRRPRGLASDDVREDITRGWKEFDRSVLPVEAWRGGQAAAMERLRMFVAEMLAGYERERSRPEVDGTSKLSPYLHFGHVGPLTIALAVEDAVKRQPKLKAARDSFFNELIAWRELSVNFVRYEPRYDSAACADNWAKLTIAKHDRDVRPARYSLKQMETACTRDELWNAAQTQMLRHGWMHNYLRMYWAKKIVEWTPNAAAAMRTAIYLNDRYFLDGRDPNGYAGVAWAVLGKFDRAWGEREIFGKRRYMSAESTRRKFDAKRYEEQMNALPVRG